MSGCSEQKRLYSYDYTSGLYNCGMQSILTEIIFVLLQDPTSWIHWHSIFPQNVSTMLYLEISFNNQNAWVQVHLAQHSNMKLAPVGELVNLIADQTHVWTHWTSTFCEQVIQCFNVELQCFSWTYFLWFSRMELVRRYCSKFVEEAITLSNLI